MDKALRKLEKFDDFEGAARFLQSRLRAGELTGLQLLFAACLGYLPVFAIDPSLAEAVNWDGEDRPLIADPDMNPPCGGARILGSDLDEKLRHYLTPDQYLTIYCEILKSIASRCEGISPEVLEDIDGTAARISSPNAYSLLTHWKRKLSKKRIALTGYLTRGAGITETRYVVAEAIYTFLLNYTYALRRPGVADLAMPLSQIFFIICGINPDLIDTHQLAMMLLTSPRLKSFTTSHRRNPGYRRNIDFTGEARISSLPAEVLKEKQIQAESQMRAVVVSSLLVASNSIKGVSQFLGEKLFTGGYDVHAIIFSDHVEIEAVAVLNPSVAMEDLGDPFIQTLFEQIHQRFIADLDQKLGLRSMNKSEVDYFEAEEMSGFTFAISVKYDISYDDLQQLLARL